MQNFSSTYHYQNNCEIFKAQSVRIQERKKEEESANAVILEVIDFALSVQRENDLSQFTREAINHAALGTCCSSSVAGKEWLDIYINSLNENIRKKQLCL